MAIDQARLRGVFEQAQGPLGVKELLRLTGLHPGHQTELKRVLREMLRAGDLEKTGKRFHLTGTSGRGKPTGTRKPAAREARPAARGGTREERPAPRGKSAGGETRREGAPSGRRRSRPAGEEDAPTIEGVLRLHPDGYGFVHPIDQEQENIFLPPQQAQKGLDNDRVQVRVFEQPDGRFAGEIVDVLQRRREFAVGIYQVHGEEAVVVPKDNSLPGPIRVPLTQIAREGDVVKVRLGVGGGVLRPGRGLVGEVAGSLGAPGSPGAEVLNIAFAQGFSDEFPAEVMDEADSFELRVTEEEANQPGRRDVREMELVTIDGEDARDFDDAIWCEPKGQDFRLVVAVADVSNYVREGRPLDIEALRRATSVYLPDRVLPMLPERLSNGICSLRPDEDRLCMVADMLIDRGGKLRDYELYPAVMRSHARCTYNEVQKVLDGEDVPHRNAFKPLFQKLESLAKTLRQMRAGRGAIDFDLPEIRVELDKDGKPLRMVQRDRLFAHRIVEECMLAANEAVAKYFQDNDLPSVYRYHGDPDEEKLATFAAVANAYGFELDPSKVSSGELNDFVKKLEGHPEQRALNQLLLRSMMQAVYSSQNVGHYGLAAEHYLHFTSPIRRYPDLLVHRQLKKVWARKGRKHSEAELEREEARLEEMAVQSSERERAAMQVEREVVNYYATLLMKDRVGEEFAAQVAGVTDFGFFVQLENELVEGLVKAESLGPGAEYDAAMHALVFAGGRKVRVGQKLTVRLVAANLERRQMEFHAVAFEGEAPLTSQKTLQSTLERFRQRQQGGGGGRDRYQQQRGRMGRHEERPAPPRQPWEEKPQKEEEAPPSSPHPGFDRLRALAAKNRAGSQGGGGSRWSQERERHSSTDRDRRPPSDRRERDERVGRTDRDGEGRMSERPTRGHRGGDKHRGKPTGRGGGPKGGKGRRR